MEDALKIFDVKYPDRVAVFIFDCSSAHEAFASDALLAHKMNHGLGGQQPKMHNTIIPTTGQPQSMVYPADTPGFDNKNHLLVGQAKGMEQVLLERGLLEELSTKSPNHKPVGVCSHKAEHECRLPMAHYKYTHGFPTGMETCRSELLMITGLHGSECLFWVLQVLATSTCETKIFLFLLI